MVPTISILRRALSPRDPLHGKDMMARKHPVPEGKFAKVAGRPQSVPRIIE